MMNRHFIFALCTVLGFSVSGISMAQSVPVDKEAAAKAKADDLLDQWKNGDATADSFGELAKTNSADSEIPLGQEPEERSEAGGGDRPPYCSSFYGNFLVRLLC